MSCAVAPCPNPAVPGMFILQDGEQKPVCAYHAAHAHVVVFESKLITQTPPRIYRRRRLFHRSHA